MKIYVASSWRNKYQPKVVEKLRAEGFEVYDFKNPRDDEHGFHWSDIDPNWKKWNAEQFTQALTHSLAEEGFDSDMTALEQADATVLVLPCGKSAHLELGHANGLGQITAIYIPEPSEPELMYKMCNLVSSDLNKIITMLKEDEAANNLPF